MKKFMAAYAACLAASLALLSCGTSGTEPESVHPRPKFELMNTAPVASYPEDNVRYAFSISFPDGLRSVETRVDGSPVEGSLVEYPDCPAEVDYVFTYTFDASQVGQTVDFVFIAECADGYRASVDYPVYVRSVSETVTVALPEGLESEAIVGDALSFDVTVSAGYPISKIRTLKNGTEIESLTKTSGFSEPKSDAYHFSYVLLKEDGGKELTLTFEASDNKGNVGIAEYKLLVRKGQPKVLYREIFDTSMRISNTTEFDTAAGGVTGSSASEFVPGNISRYNGDDETVTEGVKEGLKLFSNDKSAVSYSSDGNDTCLSKYSYSGMSLISGTYVWARKAKKGWISVSGIPLHGCTSLTLSYLQAGGAVKVEWSSDGTEWKEVCTSSATKEMRADFTVAEGTESISLRFTENGGAAHLRFDDITLKGE